MNKSQQTTMILSAFSAISKLFFILFIFGFVNNTPEYLIRLNGALKIILALYLIYRFNGYYGDKSPFTELDRKIVYSSAVYILLLSFADIIIKYIDVIRSYIIQYTNPIYVKLGIHVQPSTTEATIVTTPLPIIKA
jgi:hypothetical protein